MLFGIEGSFFGLNDLDKLLGNVENDVQKYKLFLLKTHVWKDYL